jgi:hypothetical protein
MKDEAGFERKLGEPTGRLLFAVEMYFARTGGRQIMREALQFQRGSATDDQPMLKKRLQRDDDVVSDLRRPL